MARVDHWADCRDRTFVAVKPKNPVVRGRGKKPESKPVQELKNEIEELKFQMQKREAELAQLRDEGGAEIDRLCKALEAQEFQMGPCLGQRIAKSVAKKHGLTFREMISDRRARPLVIARQEAMWLMRQYTSLSMPQIAIILGGRDHTTVIHGIRSHESRMSNG